MPALRYRKRDAEREVWVEMQFSKDVNYEKEPGHQKLALKRARL